MFLFFPLPAGVLMYMLIANIFQTAQTFFVSREPLPEDVQKLVESETKSGNRDSLPFEPSRKKEAGSSGDRVVEPKKLTEKKSTQKKSADKKVSDKNSPSDAPTP